MGDSFARMGSFGSKRFATHHGYGEVRVSRYFALYAAQVGWFVLGIWLFTNAMWPSACQPDGISKIVSCSIHLPDSGGWVEAALLSWLWSTPLLVTLEVLRWVNKNPD